MALTPEEQKRLNRIANLGSEKINALDPARKSKIIDELKRLKAKAIEPVQKPSDAEKIGEGAKAGAGQIDFVNLLKKLAVGALGSPGIYPEPEETKKIKDEIRGYKIEELTPSLIVKDVGEAVSGSTFLDPRRAIPGAVAGGVMSGVGLTEKLGEAMSKLPPNVQNYISGLMGASSVLPLKRAAVKKPKVISQVPAAAERVLDIESGLEKTTGNVGEQLVKRADKKVDQVKAQFVPISEDIANIGKGEIVTGKAGASIAMGKQAAQKINDYIKKADESGKVFGEVEKSKVIKPLKTFADSISKKGNTVEKLINQRRAFDEAINIEYAGALELPSAINKMKMDARRLVNETIEGNIKDPKLLKRFKNANKAYSEMADALDDLKRISDKSSIDVFEKGILNKGTKTIESAKKLMGDDYVKLAGYNYIAHKISELTDDLESVKFKKVIAKVDDDRGMAIFGNEWKDLKDTAVLIKRIEKPSLLLDAAKDFPVIGKFIKRYLNSQSDRAFTGKKVADIDLISFKGGKVAALGDAAIGVGKSVTKKGQQKTMTDEERRKLSEKLRRK